MSQHSKLRNKAEALAATCPKINGEMLPGSRMDAADKLAVFAKSLAGSWDAAAQLLDDTEQDVYYAKGRKNRANWRRLIWDAVDRCTSSRWTRSYEQTRKLIEDSEKLLADLDARHGR
jgi:hypothetical protein